MSKVFPLTRANTSFLPSLTRLRRLTLFTYRSPELDNLRSLTQLEEFKLRGARLEPACAMDLAPLHTLTHLQLDRCMMHSVEFLRSLTRLRRLLLGELQEEVKTLEPLRTLTCLTVLAIDGAPHLPNEALQPLSSLISLQSLSMMCGGTSLTEVALCPLTCLTRLRSLNIVNMHSMGVSYFTVFTALRAHNTALVISMKTVKKPAVIEI